jgi:hypothetical protein
MLLQNEEIDGKLVMEDDVLFVRNSCNSPCFMTVLCVCAVLATRLVHRVISTHRHTHSQMVNYRHSNLLTDKSK